MSETSGKGYVIEDLADGRTLIATGPWSSEASAAVERPDVDGVWLNYARGYTEADLSFIEAWPIRRLNVLDRSIIDLAPLARLGQTLENLSVQAAPGATLDLASLPQLRSIGAYWDVIRETLYAPEYLREVVVLEYGEVDLDPLTVQPSLQRLQLKVAPRLETLYGAEQLLTLTYLSIVEARRLHEPSAVEAAAPTLRELVFDSCPVIHDLDFVRQLAELRFLEVGDCGAISSFKPLADLPRLEALYAWGTTRVDDNDLSPLLGIRTLTEIRMRDRRQYQPRLAAVKEQLGCA